jgi:uncharacterized protein YdaU (DUF1376 family)
MSKKNLPNIPIYIGDWERDCNILSLESEMAWMKIVFKMHLGGKQSVYKTSTKGLQILWKSTQEKVDEILDELRFNDICTITDITGGHEFLCRRNAKENDISKVRSEAVSERYKTDKKTEKVKTKSTKPLQTTYKTLQTTDYDYENESDYDNDIKSKSVIKSGIKIQKPKLDFEEIIDIFNSVCYELPKAQTIGEKRKTAIRNILKNHTLEQIGEVFKNTAESDFLNGRVTSFTASFDWVLKPDNFIKILEHNYKNNKNGNTNNNQPKTINERCDSINKKTDAYFD